MNKIASNTLTGQQKKHLRGLAHNLKPVVMVGQKGATPALVESVEAALRVHELIKIRFVEARDRQSKDRIVDDITAQTRCEIAGTVGHTAILYRSHPDPEKRCIILPRRPSRPVPPGTE